MKYTRKIRLVLLLLTIAFATFGAVTVNAAPNYNSTNTINLKLKKKKSAKLKGLTKEQKKKKWTFKSSDTSIVKVKRSGKYGYKLTANKKKDGYAVIRATQSKTAIYLLVKVGKGSTSTNGTTRAWASYGRSAFRQGTSAYNTWNKVVNPNSGGNGGNGGNGSTGSGSTGSGSTDWYATHPQYTNVLAVYGARDNKMVPTPATSVVGKDQNGYGYDTNGIIGTDRNGKKIKGIIPPITFTIETVPWFDQYLRSFDNGYYAGNGGPNYIGKNVLFNAYGLSPETLGYVRVKTSAPIDDANAKALHGVKVTGAFIDGNWKGQTASRGYQYTDSSAALGSGTATASNGGLGNKFNGYYIGTVGSTSQYGTYRYSVTIDGVTKHVDFKIVNHETEFQNWFYHRYTSIPQSQVDALKTQSSYPDAVAEAATRIGILCGSTSQPKLHAYTYTNSNSILRGIPSFMAEKVLPANSVGTPGCSLAQAYSNAASRILQQNINISPGYWNVVEVAGNGHTFGYTAIWYDGAYRIYPYFYG